MKAQISGKTLVSTLQWPQIESILRNHLAHFGLNPNDWTLIRKRRIFDLKKIEVKIQHREDRTLELTGIAQVCRLEKPHFTVYWKMISLSGLSNRSRI